MHKLIIHKLGPIEHAEIECNKFMVFTGSQASGKSTIAKALFFFRTIKDDILDLILRKVSGAKGETKLPFLFTIDALFGYKLNDIFGLLSTANTIDEEMFIEYNYSKAIRVRMKMVFDFCNAHSHMSHLGSELSPQLELELSLLDEYFANHSDSISDEEKRILKMKLSLLFGDEFDMLFIPAGRSITTLLGNQLTYLYSIMDDAQKERIDYCTRKYLETVIKLRPEFKDGLVGLERRYPAQLKSDADVYKEAGTICQNILKSSYKFYQGNEYLTIDTKNYMDINHASSGQQESVWILNLLFYYLLQNKPVFFIIEEPESHLFPEAQKAITELIALVYNSGHQMLITTHSPYVLGSINNLIYASELASKDQPAVEEIISKNLWIQRDGISAWYVHDGKPQDCIDAETGFIQNELIDEISGVINDTFDKLLDIQTESEEAGE